MPVAIKDVILTEGQTDHLRFTNSEEFRRPYDATAVERLEVPEP